MTKAATIKTTLTLPEDLHWALEKTVVDRRTTKINAVREALSRWVQGETEPQPKARTRTKDLSPENEVLMSQFEDLLRNASGPSDKVMLAAIKTYLTERSK